ncbi:MAG: tyrosine-type recombinase/integrase [Actinomycetota bacterium]|nr:tyrosine-type recombinase/integrase [Actinomycetota bacterium]
MARGAESELRVLEGGAAAADGDLVGEYLATLGGRSSATVDAYRRILGQLARWVAERPGGASSLRPELLTRTAVEGFLSELEARGHGTSHRAKAKSAISGFATWLVEEKGLLRRNPTRGVEVPASQLLAPRRLSPDQRYVLKNLVEKEGSPRSAAIFALGYWAGCRVSDVSWLKAEDCHVGPKVGWLRVGHKGGKVRDIDLINRVRRPLYEYLGGDGGRDPKSPYAFTSQRAARLTEAGVHHWFRKLRSRATKDEWELVGDVTFHDLRHDFAHRAREAGWAIEEVAYYLGHVTKKGTPAIATTARYTQVSREDVREKLRDLGG